MNRFIIAILTALLATTALAGPTSPPSGPIAPTMKTLTEVEPRTPISAANTPGDADCLYKITAAGSYYLSGPISVPFASGKSAIKITSSNVTIDLAGFTIQGYLGTSDGIRTAVAATDNITVRNGSIRGMSGVGVNTPGGQCRCEDVNVLMCQLAGIYLGDGAAVANCTVIGADGNGITTAERSTVLNCRVQGAYRGVSTGDKCIVRDCSAVSNASDGFSVSCGSAISHCTASANAGYGIFGCAAMITDCACHSNTKEGIFAGGGCTVSRCVCNGNAAGITCFSGCTISNNLCRTNIGDGITVSVDDNRIEANTCIDNGVGIRAVGSSNIFVRNMVSGSTFPYTLAAGNRYGPIVDVRAPGSPAVNGPSAASTLTTTDPNANFSY